MARNDLKLYRATYRDRHGQRKTSPKWHAEYRDLRGRPRKLTLTTSKETSHSAFEKFTDALRLARSGRIVDPATVPPLVRQRLFDDMRAVGHRGAEILNPMGAWAGYVDPFIATLKAKRRDPRYIQGREKHVREVLSGCGFVAVTDLDGERIESFVSEKIDGGMGLEVANHRLRAVRQFCRWLANEKHVLPVCPKITLFEVTKRRHARRILEPDRLLALLETTREAPTRFGFTGPQRWLLYFMAARTGLRRDELKSLRWSNLKLDTTHATWSLEVNQAKNRKRVTLPLLGELPDILRDWRAEHGPCLPSAPVFPQQARWDDTSLMLQADLADAGIPFKVRVEDADAPNGERFEHFDFHSFRHLFGTYLCREGTPPNVVKKLMRHSSITLTMDTYAEHFERAELDVPLPTLGAAAKAQGRKAKAG